MKLSSINLSPAHAPSRRIVPTGVRAVEGLNTSAKDGFVFVTAPGSEAADRYRHMLSEILGRTWARKRMLVTSASPGEGKTLTAVNLALAFDEKRLSVLLVELTLTRPRYRYVFGEPPSTRGVETVLRGEASPDEVTFQLGDTRVAILSVGKPMLDNSLLQDNANLDRLLKFGDANYDWTILDVPSMGDSQEVKGLAAQADPVLLVARSHKTKVDIFRKATHILGRDLDYVILNDIAS